MQKIFKIFDNIENNVKCSFNIMFVNKYVNINIIYIKLIHFVLVFVYF